MGGPRGLSTADGRTVSTFRLARVRGEQAAEVWPLPLDRPTLLGRADRGQEAPDIDLWPDYRVSRLHARLVPERGAWWIEDLDSKHGTRVDGREIRGLGRVRLEPGAEIQAGVTTLLLAGPTWRRFRGDGLVIEVEITPAINYALVHWRPDLVVSRLVVRNWSSTQTRAAQLTVAVARCGESDPLAIPPLAPGEGRALAPPGFRLDHLLETQTERIKRAVSVRLDGRSLEGERVDCWILAHNEWSTADEHRLALAAFVLPNHPLVAQATLDAAPPGGWSDDPAGALSALYGYFAQRWHLAYRVEPPHWDARSQKIRLPHQVLLDPLQRRGEGTCIDLALLLAACLERLGHQPLIAILDLGAWQHALVGCWRRTAERLESLVGDRQRLVEGAHWVDATGSAWDAMDPACHVSFDEAAAVAAELLADQPLLFGLDVVAARRQDGVTPLPFGGAPLWSEAAAQAIDAARACAAAVPTQLSTIPLLIGLLSVEAGLTRQILAAQLGDADAVCERLRAALPRQQPPPAPSQNYVTIRHLAQTAAQAEGSPFVLEYHLLAALLDTPTASLDRALEWLGSSRHALRAALDQVRGGGAGPRSTYSVFSEFPSSA
jgi:hypothetical protein